MARVVLHPILSNRFSRFIFLYFLSVGLLASVYLWWEMKEILKAAQIDTVFFLTSFLSRVLIFLFIVLIVSALTGSFITGPVERVSQWLLDWEHGHRVAPFHVRRSSVLVNVVDLLNGILKQSKTPKKP